MHSAYNSVKALTYSTSNHWRQWIQFQYKKDKKENICLYENLTIIYIKIIYIQRNFTLLYNAFGLDVYGNKIYIYIDEKKNTHTNFVWRAWYILWLFSMVFLRLRKERFFWLWVAKDIENTYNNDIWSKFLEWQTRWRYKYSCKKKVAA